METLRINAEVQCQHLTTEWQHTCMSTCAFSQIRNCDMKFYLFLELKVFKWIMNKKNGGSHNTDRRCLSLRSEFVVQCG